jgi:hypothetical protein
VRGKRQLLKAYKEKDAKAGAGKNKAEPRNEAGQMTEHNRAVARHSRLEPYPNPITGLDQVDRHNSPPENPRIWPVISEIPRKLAVNRDTVRENDGAPAVSTASRKKYKASPLRSSLTDATSLDFGHCESQLTDDRRCPRNLPL